MMRAINKSELIQALQLVGWKLDKHGHAQKHINVTRPADGFPLGKTTLTQYRIRMMENGASVETKVYVTATAKDPSRTAWEVQERVSYQEIKITESSHIRIGKFLF